MTGNILSVVFLTFLMGVAIKSIHELGLVMLKDISREREGG